MRSRRVPRAADVDRLTFADLQERRRTILRAWATAVPPRLTRVSALCTARQTRPMPELPRCRPSPSARRDAGWLRAHRLEPLGFTGLKTVEPSPDSSWGVASSGDERGKYLVFEFDGGQRVLVHLSQAGRLDVETPRSGPGGKGRRRAAAFGDPRRDPRPRVRHGAQGAWWCSPVTTDHLPGWARTGHHAFEDWCCTAPTVGASTRCCATRPRSPASGGATPTTRCGGPPLAVRDAGVPEPEQRTALVAAVRSVLADAWNANGPAPAALGTEARRALRGARRTAHLSELW